MRVVLVRAPAAESRALVSSLVDVLHGRYLHGFQVANVVTADSPDERDTANVLSDALDAALETHAALNGPADGADDASPDTGGLEAAQEDAWAILESWRTTLAAEDAVVVVSTDAIVRLLICRALSISLGERARFRIDPASISVIDFRQRTMVSRINDVCHL